MSSESTDNPSTFAVKFDNVSKCYTQNDGAFLLKSFLHSLKTMNWGKRVRNEGFYALRDVSFTIHKGERVAIIGRNGAGKSTTLKLINRVSMPSSGEIIINGTTGGVIELGAGFNSELSARDNINIMGALYGHSREKIAGFMDEIFDISELHRFKDVPLKKFSSGMRTRLAFALSMTATPDIVLLDEVLAVGDADFRKKSSILIEQFLKDRTLVLVSHSEKHVKEVCDRVIFIESGQLVFDGPAHEGIRTYMASLKRPVTSASTSLIIKDRRGMAEEPAVKFTDAQFLTKYKKGDSTPKFLAGHKVLLQLTTDLAQRKSGFVVKIRLKAPSMGGNLQSQLAAYDLNVSPAATEDSKKIILSFDTHCLPDGRYWLEIEPELLNQSTSVATQLIELPFIIHTPTFSKLNTPVQGHEHGMVKVNFNIEKDSIVFESNLIQDTESV